VVYDVTLERRIRELCAQVVAAQDSEDFQPILSELREALREHAGRLQNLVAEYPFLVVDPDNVVQIPDRSRKARGSKKGRAS